MPEHKTLERARRARRQGKSPSTQAAPFVHEEIEQIWEGKHGARSTKQVIAIGLSKARRAGVKLRPPKKGQAFSPKSAKTRDVIIVPDRAAPTSRRPSALVPRSARSRANHAGSRLTRRCPTTPGPLPGAGERRTPGFGRV